MADQKIPDMSDWTVAERYQFSQGHSVCRTSVFGEICRVTIWTPCVGVTLDKMVNPLTGQMREATAPASDTITVPLHIGYPQLTFRRVMEYPGVDSGYIEIGLPDAIRGIGHFRLPRSMFSDEINGKLAEVRKRED